jgi:hypothetical protein
MDRVDVGGPGLDPGAAHEARHQPTPGKHVDLGQFLGQSHRIVEDRQWVAQQHEFGALRGPGQDGGLEGHGRPQAGGGVMMFVQHQPIKPHRFSVLVFIQILVIQICSEACVEVTVGKGQAYA